MSRRSPPLWILFARRDSNTRLSSVVASFSFVRSNVSAIERTRYAARSMHANSHRSRMESGRATRPIRSGPPTSRPATPYTMRADVWFPAPPDSAQLQVGVTLDTIPLLVHIRCAPA